MKKKRRKIAAVLLSVMMMSLTACGNNGGDVQEAAVPVKDEMEISDNESVVEDEAEPEEEEIEEPEGEAEEIEEEVILSYAEENELEFCKDTVLTVKGTRTDINNEEDIEQMDAEWNIKSIEISDAEEGLQTITIRHECTGYLWTDDKTRYLFKISMPSARYCDLNTGKCFPTITMSEEGKLGYQTEVKWDGKTYEINYTESVEWNDGTEWKHDGNGGNILPSTMIITDTLVVTEGYEGLGMILSPLTIDGVQNKKYGVHDEKEFFINEILEADKGSVLFDMMDMYSMLGEDTDNSNIDSESSKDGENSNIGTFKENVSVDNAVPKDDGKSQQSSHVHSYSSAVTKNPSCLENGIKTYTCSCGDSYTETIDKTDHQWVQVTETITHPSSGHYETVTEKTYSCMNMNVCGYDRYGTWEEFEAHCNASEEAWNAAHVDWWDSWDGSFETLLDEMCTLCSTDGFIQLETTKDVWVVDSEAWTETVTMNQCSVCLIKQ